MHTDDAGMHQKMCRHLRTRWTGSAFVTALISPEFQVMLLPSNLTIMECQDMEGPAV